jgi:hypothetical protein
MMSSVVGGMMTPEAAAFFARLTGPLLVQRSVRRIVKQRNSHDGAGQ